MGQREAAIVICDAIRTAEIVFRDGAGNKLFEVGVGEVRPGDTIEYKVPVPEQIKIHIG